MSKKLKYISVSLVFLVGLCLWSIFLLENEMSNYGIYTLVSYEVYTIISFIPFICICGTVIWFIISLIKSIKNKTLKGNVVIMSLLITALVAQGGYLLHISNQMLITTVAYIESVDPMKEEIIINNGGEQIVLECPMTIYELLEVNKEYGVTYQHKKGDLGRGKVNLVKLIKD